jgi:DNA-binding XRE family transcriptional regulator
MGWESLLVGNGMSINVRPTSLTTRFYKGACRDFDGSLDDEDIAVLEKFGTTNFEVVLAKLRDGIILRTGRALRSLREERELTRQQLADRSPTTADFIGQIEEGKCSNPGLRMLEELCPALKGEGSELTAQIEPVRAARKAAVQTVLDELAERDARSA